MNAGDSCVANIGPRERNKRLGFGAVALVLSVAISAIFVVEGVPPIWRLTLFAPLFAGALGFFQARDRTCVSLASRGLRDLDSGPQSIVDAGERAQIQRQARAVYVKAFVSAAILTAIALLN